MASLVAVGAGAAILAAMGFGPGSWFRHPLAWTAGAVLAAGLLATGRSPAVLRSFMTATPFALAATLLAPGQEGVHRWLDLGPLHVNIAALLLAPMIVAVAFAGIWSRAAIVICAATAVLLVLQPDASQATSFLAAVIVLLIRAPSAFPRRMAAIGIAGLLLVASWLRPDPLQPVPEVEEIVSLGFLIAPAAAFVGLFALAGAALAPLAVRGDLDPKRWNAALALTAYFGSAALCPAFGDFPVPLMGLGMSFPIGYWLAVALLCARPPAADAGLIDQDR